MTTSARVLWVAFLAGVFLAGGANAQLVTVPVDSSNGAAWLRSDGGTGTTMPTGGPGIWNARFVAAIPAGATNITFTLDGFFPDDKGVVQLNGTIIGDAVIFGANGAAAGPGTFDFGLGGGNQAYTYAGFTPGGAVALPNGTTTFTLIVFINDTGVASPSSPPLAQTFLSSFSLNGSLSYLPAQVQAATPITVPTLSEWTLLLLIGLLIAAAAFHAYRRPR